ncbi:MAG: glycosyltransferase family 2 protein [Pyrinomonadaceae bacterium]
MSAKKRVEIVMPVYNRREITLQCLKSLARIDQTGLEIHIIVVDDGSTDGTSEAIRASFPKVEIIAGDGNLWYTGGTNRGIEAALKHNPDYVLAINDDEVFDDQFLRRMVDCAETNSRSVVGGLLLLWDQPHKVFQIAPEWNTWQGGWRQPAPLTVFTVPQEPFEVRAISGNCIMFPAAAIRECGLMDEKNFKNFGDAEYTPRMKRRGWQLLIEPRARVFCQPNAAGKQIRQMPPREIFNKLLVDTGSQHNLRSRFMACWVGAPTKIQAVIGFAVLVARLGLSAVGLNKNWQKTNSGVN